MKQPGKVFTRFLSGARSYCTALLTSLLLLTAISVSAIPIPTLGFFCTQTITPTSVCTGSGGFFANGWVPGTGYWEWTINTTGYQNIIFSTPTSKSSAGGPTSANVYFSTPGFPFTYITSYTPSTSCNIIGPILLPPVCNNQSMVKVRIYMTGATQNAATSRVNSQNVFDGQPIPPVDTFSFSAPAISQHYDAVPNNVLPENIFVLNYSYFSQNHPTQYLNVYVKDLAGGNKAWAAENLPLSSSAGAHATQYHMNLQSLFAPGTPVGTLGVYYTVSPTITSSPSLPPDSLFAVDSVLRDTSFIGHGGLKDSLSGSPTDTTAYINAWFAGGTDTKVTHDNMPNIDLDSATYKANLPDYAGDWNACGPASCANSMQWLENEKKVKFDSVISHRDKLKAISKYMNRAANDGAQSEQLIKGKLGFIDRYKLPIVVKFQDDDTQDSIIKAPDTTYKHFAKNESRNRTDRAKNHIGWDWLWQEMSLDKDVEIWIVNKNMVTNKWEGFSHYVVVTEVRNTKGVLRLTFKDDDNQKKTDAKKLREVTVTIDTTDDGFPYVKEWDDKPAKKLLNRKFIVGIYSEGLDTNIKYTGAKPAAGLGYEADELPVQLFNNPMHDGQVFTALFTTKPGKSLQVSITDINGRLVTAYTGTTQATNRYSWNGTAANGQAVAAGTYIMHIAAGDKQAVVKIVKE